MGKMKDIATKHKEWKDRERDLNARAKACQRGRLFWRSLIPVNDGKGGVMLIGATYRRNNRV